MPLHEIEVQDEFSAAHFLKLYDGSWEDRHGHDWKVSVVMQSQTLDSMEVVFDFETLKPTLKKTLAELSETSINDHPDFKGEKQNPSTENIAKFICERLLKNLKSEDAKIKKVTVWETPDASASYYP